MQKALHCDPWAKSNPEENLTCPVPLMAMAGGEIEGRSSVLPKYHLYLEQEAAGSANSPSASVALCANHCDVWATYA